MLLWLLFATMTAAVLVVLLRPLLRPQAGPSVDAAADIAVYKDQLAEIDADLARGIVAPAEAEVARREIARRLLARADVAPAAPAPRAALRPLATGLAAVFPLAALGGYALLGSPGLPDRPRAPAVQLDKAPVAELVAQVEARLAERPDDGRGWDVIAPIYFRQERFAEAAHAYAKAAALLGETTPRLAGFAEATVMANNGIVGEPARLAYEKIAKADPSRMEPKFWLALAKEQDGRLSEAAVDYRALLAAAPPGATWKPLVEERLAIVEKRPAPGPNPGSGPRGPNAADVKAAEGMSEADRSTMIRGMVESLSARLANNPNDLPGWQRLLQSHLVLGERDKAVAALADARRGLAGNAAALAELTAFARSIGLGS